MRGFLLRMLVSAVGLWLSSLLVGGIQIEGSGTLLGAALLLGVVNAVVRPLLIVLTFPLTVITLGLFLLVINAAMLGLVAWMLPSFHIAGFFSALAGAVIVGLTSYLASWYIGPRGRIEILVVSGGRELR